MLISRYKIIITEEYLFSDLGSLGKRIEYGWDKIYRVSRIPFSFLWMYKIHCKDNPSLMLSSMIANYVELLEEIIKRSPNAIVDDSVRKFLEKHHNKGLKQYPFYGAGLSYAYGSMTTAGNLECAGPCTLQKYYRHTKNGNICNVISISI